MTVLLLLAVVALMVALVLMRVQSERREQVRVPVRVHRARTTQRR